jgi:hypothetical protein
MGLKDVGVKRVTETSRRTTRRTVKARACLLLGTSEEREMGGVGVLNG